MSSLSEALTARARKAWTGAGIAFLGPLVVLLAATEEPLTVRSVLASVVSGLSGGLGVFYTVNDDTELEA